MSKSPIKTLVCLSMLLGLLVVAQPAQAYYWGFSPYGYGGTSMWPLRSVIYPLRNLGYGYGYGSRYGYGYSLAYSAPYLASSLLGAALYYRRPYMDTQQYQDEEPFSNPRSRVRPTRTSPVVADQNVSARWTKPPQTPVTPPVYLPEAQPKHSTGRGAPLAAGFIDLVNSKFDGDISQALFDPEARSWARAIGVIDNDNVFSANLNNERVALIQTVMKDASIDPAAKIQTIRVLLQH